MPNNEIITWIGRLTIAILSAIGAEAVLMMIIAWSGVGDGDGAKGLERALICFVIGSVFVIPASFYMVWRITKG